MLFKKLNDEGEEGDGMKSEGRKVEGSRNYIWKLP